MLLLQGKKMEECKQLFASLQAKCARPRQELRSPPLRGRQAPRVCPAIRRGWQLHQLFGCRYPGEPRLVLVQAALAFAEKKARPGDGGADRRSPLKSCPKVLCTEYILCSAKNCMTSSLPREEKSGSPSGELPPSGAQNPHGLRGCCSRLGCRAFSPPRVGPRALHAALAPR